MSDDFNLIQSKTKNSFCHVQGPECLILNVILISMWKFLKYLIYSIPFIYLQVFIKRGSVRLPYILYQYSSYNIGSITLVNWNIYTILKVEYNFPLKIWLESILTEEVKSTEEQINFTYCAFFFKYLYNSHSVYSLYPISKKKRN